MKKVLIVYSSWAGTTHEIANEVGKVFQEYSYNVDVIRADDPIISKNYNAYIIGTSIHAGQTVRSFRQFIKKNLDTLKNKPTAVFVVCANMMNDTEKNRQETLTWLNNAIGKYDVLKPISIGLFGGAFITEGNDFNALNFLIRKMIVSMKKKIIEDQEKTDFRDWESIRGWAVNLATSISE